MRSIPPPIRNVELRDRLGELLKEALRMEGRSGLRHLRCAFEEMASGQTRSVLRDELHTELSAVSDRMDAYCRVLERLPPRGRRPADPVGRALEEAAQLFNEGLFFEVHEVLETVWLTQTGGIRRLLQGLIQIAVGFHHLERNNLKGALALLKEGTEKVKACGSNRSRVTLDQFVAQVEYARRSIESLGEAACDRFDRRMIPNMPLTQTYDQS